MRTASEAQQAVLARGRESQRHCKECGADLFGVSRSGREFGGSCYGCYVRCHDVSVREQASQRAAALLAETDSVVLDTETTGLEQPEIVEIAIVVPDGSVLLDTLVRPLSAVENGARAVHGISDESLASAPSWAEVWPTVRAITNGRRIVAYNDEFDRRAIRTTCALYRLTCVKRAWVDVMRLYAEWYGDYRESYGDYIWQPLPGGGHRAADDCRAVLAVLRLMAGHPDSDVAEVGEDPMHDEKLPAQTSL